MAVSQQQFEAMAVVDRWMGAFTLSSNEVALRVVASVTIAGGATEAKQDVGNASLASIDGKLPAMSTSVPDNNASGQPVRPIGEDIWRCSFAESGASVLSSHFEILHADAGVGYSQSSGNLLVTAGTNANEEFLIRSKDPATGNPKAWRGAWNLRFSHILSQRNANNNFEVLLADRVADDLPFVINSATSVTFTWPAGTNPFTSQNVGQSMMIGGIASAAVCVPGRYAIASVSGDTTTFTVASWAATGSGTADLFGRSYVRALFTGATATSATLGTQRNGFSTVADAGYTVLTTASPGAEMQFHNSSTEVSFQDKLIASSATPNMTMRAKRDESIPDDNVDLYLYVWSHNGASAPSATTWTLQFVNVEKFANLDVYLRGVKPMGTDNPIAVIFQATPTVTVGTLPATPAGTNTIGGVRLVADAGQGSATSHRTAFVANITTGVPTLVKNSATQLNSFRVANNSGAGVWVHLYNLTTAPTLGTSTPEVSLFVKAGDTEDLDCGPYANRFGTGLSYAITDNCAANPAVGGTISIASTAAAICVSARYT